jgi:hypothetical protein
MAEECNLCRPSRDGAPDAPILVRSVRRAQASTMQETRGRVLAAGNVAEVYKWGPHALKLYRSPAAKRVQ